MNKNILIVEGRHSVGGGQIMTCKIANVLNLKYNVIIFLPNGRQQDLQQYLYQFKQYHYKLYPYSRGVKNLFDCFKFIFNFFNVFISMRKCIISNDISLIYVQSPSLLPIVSIVSTILRKKVVVHLHVVHTDRKTRKLLNYFLGLQVVKKIIGVSDYTLSQLTHKNRNKATIIHNCVDFDDSKRFKLPPKRDDIVISIIGDVVHSKGQHIALKALSSCSLKFDLNVNVIGNIISLDYLDILKKIYPKANIIGKVSNVSEWIDKSTLVLIPSLYETFSLSMVESWSRGVPTIASNYGGMKELVEIYLPRYSHVMLFDVGNTTDLSKKITILLNDMDLYHEISKKEVCVVKKEFTSKVFTDKIIQLLDKYIQ